MRITRRYTIKHLVEVAEVGVSIVRHDIGQPLNCLPGTVTINHSPYRSGSNDGRRMIGQ